MMNIPAFRADAYAKAETVLDAFGHLLPDSSATDEGRAWCVGGAIAVYALTSTVREEAGASMLSAEETLMHLGRLIDLMNAAHALEKGEPVEGAKVEETV